MSVRRLVWAVNGMKTSVNQKAGFVEGNDYDALLALAKELRDALRSATRDLDAARILMSPATSEIAREMVADYSAVVKKAEALNDL